MFEGGSRARQTLNSISLPAYNVEKRGQDWYYWRAPFFSRESPRGPYGSAMSVCMMIARELVQEITTPRRKK
jgi:hypothetical protein